MLNEVPMMVLAIVGCQAGIAALLVVMARLEPGTTDTAPLPPSPPET